MSKIMRQLYAEAIAAREAASAAAHRPPSHSAEPEPAAPASRGPCAAGDVERAAPAQHLDTIGWWVARYEEAQRAHAERAP